MKRVLTAEDMEIARLAVKGLSDRQIGEQVGRTRETVCIRRKRPDIAAYMEKLQAPLRARIEKATQADFDKAEEKTQSVIREFEEKVAQAQADITWSRNEAASLIREIAYNVNARESDRITAVKTMNEMFGFGNAQPPKPGGDQIPETPSFYKSEWRQ